MTPLEDSGEPISQDSRYSREIRHVMDFYQLPLRDFEDGGERCRD